MSKIELDFFDSVECYSEIEEVLNQKESEDKFEVILDRKSGTGYDLFIARHFLDTKVLYSCTARSCNEPRTFQGAFFDIESEARALYATL